MRAERFLAACAFVFAALLAMGQQPQAQTRLSDKQLLELVRQQQGPMPKARLLERPGTLPQTAITSTGTSISFHYFSDGRLRAIQGSTRSREIVYADGGKRPIAVIARDTGAAKPSVVRTDDPMTLDAIEHLNATKGAALFEALRSVRANITSAVPLPLATQVAKVAGGQRATAPVTPATTTASSTRIRSPDDPSDEDPPSMPLPGEPGFSDPLFPEQDPFVPGGDYGFLLCQTPFSCVACLGICQSAADQGRRGCDVYKPSPGDEDPNRWSQWMDCINDQNRLQIYCGLLCL